MFKNQFEIKVLNVRLCMGNFSIWADETPLVETDRRLRNEKDWDHANAQFGRRPRAARARTSACSIDQPA